MSCVTVIALIYRYGMVLRQPVNGPLLMAWTQLAGKLETRNGILRSVGFQMLHELQHESNDVFLFVVVLEGAHDSQQGILQGTNPRLCRRS